MFHTTFDVTPYGWTELTNSVHPGKWHVDCFPYVTVRLIERMRYNKPTHAFAAGGTVSRNRRTNTPRVVGISQIHTILLLDKINMGKIYDSEHFEL